MNIILGIETSCDETAASVVVDGYRVLSNVIYSQVDKHANFGGVVPEYAARLHFQYINNTVIKAIDDANISINDVDAIAVTNGPGLIPSLLVGVNFAIGFSLNRNIPLFGINHVLAHVYGAMLKHENHNKLLDRKDMFPILSLVVSGGHTVLLMIDEFNCVHVIGTTVDDAAGEALDKGARIMGLSYPGGPIIENMAKRGNKDAYKFPRAMMHKKHKLNFSFSGLKTALINYVNKLGGIDNFSIEQLHDTVASYQFAIVDVLCKKVLKAINSFGCKTLIIGGGVAQNIVLRNELNNKLPKDIALLLTPIEYCGDNGAMIAGLCWYHNYYYTDNKCSNNSNLGVYSTGYPKMF